MKRLVKGTIVGAVITFLAVGCATAPDTTVERQPADASQAFAPSDVVKQMSLVEAAENGRVEEVKRLLKQGVDVDQREDGLTPLMCAACQGHVAIARILLQHGADVTAQASGRRHLPVTYFAIEGNNPTIQSLLCKHGAGDQITGRIADIDTNIVVEARGYFFGLVFNLKEYPNRRLFVTKARAIEWGLIEPTIRQFEKMKCRPGFAVGKQITITAFEHPGGGYNLVVQAALASDNNKDNDHSKMGSPIKGSVKRKNTSPSKKNPSFFRLASYFRASTASLYCHLFRTRYFFFIG